MKRLLRTAEQQTDIIKDLIDQLTDEKRIPAHERREALEDLERYAQNAQDRV